MLVPSFRLQMTPPRILVVVCFKFVFSKLLGPNISAPTFQDEHFSTCLATMWRGVGGIAGHFTSGSAVCAQLSLEIAMFYVLL